MDKSLYEKQLIELVRLLAPYDVASLNELPFDPTALLEQLPAGLIEDEV